MEKTAREGTKGAAQPTRLNTLEMFREFNKILGRSMNGDFLPVDCVLILAVIRTESEKGNICKRGTINDQIGKRIYNGKMLSILENNGLIKTHKPRGYINTIEGEILLNSAITDISRILLSKPTRHKPRPRPRPKPPIETFEQLVKETLNKKGLNKRVKYALLRTLGMKADQAKQAVKAIAPLKNTERIKPVLNVLLSKIITADTPKATQGT